MPGPATPIEWLKYLKRTEQFMLLNELMVLVICKESTEQPCRFAPVNICQPVRSSNKRTVQKCRELDEVHREKESDAKDINIAVPKRQSTRTDPVHVLEAPTDVLDDLKADSNKQNQKL